MDLIKVDTFLQSTFRDNLDRGHPKGMEPERREEQGGVACQWKDKELV